MAKVEEGGKGGGREGEEKKGRGRRWQHSDTWHGD